MYDIYENEILIFEVKTLKEARGLSRALRKANKWLYKINDQLFAKEYMPKITYKKRGK